MRAADREQLEDLVYHLQLHFTWLAFIAGASVGKRPPNEGAQTNYLKAGDYAVAVVIRGGSATAAPSVLEAPFISFGLGFRMSIEPLK